MTYDVYIRANTANDGSVYTYFCADVGDDEIQAKTMDELLSEVTKFLNKQVKK